ncbi:Flp family type IVb pilin [Paeniglutamicibacter sp. ZC-3]|uniref:Flp family type IVb pilin n=1 Tax=Paeniglutamicibacter sp. ZC-3 TaxID=2986919 RepID=UPI0021F6FAE2|nr:Flp family type IVb pilin [Paeniglutamicibacter sp. ZC-3]MCV9996241.1 Flp family type IVb pilin [Paeniglutamicibacter sp. ZC-3]
MLHVYATLQTLGFRIKNRIQRDETGATAVEYGIMVGVIAVAIIATLMLLGPQLNALFVEVNTQLKGIGTTPTTP